MQHPSATHNIHQDVPSFSQQQAAAVAKKREIARSRSSTPGISRVTSVNFTRDTTKDVCERNSEASSEDTNDALRLHLHQERSQRHFPDAPSDEREKIMFENIRHYSIDDDQVPFSSGRHTDVAHEDELVLAADGPKQPLCDTPVSLLAAPDVATARFASIDTESIPTSQPRSVTSTSDSIVIDRCPNSDWEDNYQIEISVFDQEKHVPSLPPPQQEATETSHTSELQFAVSSVIREAVPNQA
uniref:Uncharacterized protein n=1 Tax=Caenorhabditis japonica TaxID=281687 RepID=A0A8R1IC89_CAEJA